MRNLVRAALPVVAALTALALGAADANAAVYSSSYEYASYTTGGYTIYNDEWGSGHNSQTLWVNSANNWGVTSTQPATSGVKAYGNITKTVGTALNSLSWASSTFAESMPSTGNFESAYDIWLNNSNYEVMIWTNSQYVSPAGSAIGPVSLDGATWWLWSGTANGHPVYSFVRSGNVSYATINILTFLKYLENTKGYYNNPTLTSIQYGFEISSTDNNSENFAITNYSASAG